MYTVIIFLPGMTDSFASQPTPNFEEAQHLYQSVQQYFEDHGLAPLATAELVS